MISPAVKLYRDLLRQCRRLPRGPTQVYYKNFIKTNFIAYRDEENPDLLARIFEQAPIQADWVVQKYAQQTTAQ